MKRKYDYNDMVSLKNMSYETTSNIWMDFYKDYISNLYDYTNRASWESVKQSTIEKTEKRLNIIKMEILKRIKTD